MKSILLIITLLLSTSLYARGGRDRGFKILDELNLSKEQMAKIEKFKEEQKAKRKEGRGSRKEHREKMKQLFVEGASDSEMRKHHESMSSRRGKRAEMRFEKMLFLKNLLTKQQRQAYIEKKESRREQRRGRRGRRGGWKRERRDE